MVPPLSQGSSGALGSDSDISRPLSEWIPVHVYNTEADCNKEIDAMNKRATGWARSHHTMLDISHAQCIATDDPRLKGK